MTPALPRAVRLSVCLSLFVGMVGGGIPSRTIADGRTPFDPRPWIEDLDQVKHSMATQYANLEWAEAAVRMTTSVTLKSERLAFVRGIHWTNRFARMAAELRAAAGQATGADRILLSNFADQVDRRRVEAQASCDLTLFWSGQHPRCQWLGDAFYSSGLVDAESKAIQGKPWESLVFHQAAFRYPTGVWSGPLIVLIDEGTGSAATQFAALLQDNHAALIMGMPANGGCGNSGAVFELPDCVRLRADGSNEVMGVLPDLFVGFVLGDGPLRQGAKILDKLPEGIQRAMELMPTGAATVRRSGEQKAGRR